MSPSKCNVNVEERREEESRRSHGACLKLRCVGTSTVPVIILILLHNSPLSYLTASMPGRSNYKVNYWEHEGRASSRINLRTLYVLYSKSSMSWLASGDRKAERVDCTRAISHLVVPDISFCSLHGMGPIRSDVGRPHYFLDLFHPLICPIPLHTC